MIINKYTNTEQNSEIKNAIEFHDEEQTQKPESYDKVWLNPLEEVYNAARRTLLSLNNVLTDGTKEPIFNTVRLDTGQFDRIIRSKGNEEYAVSFPAAFIRFVNVRYLVAQQRIGEGRATMRIRFILNDLNNNDDVVETHGFRVFNMINEAIQDAKDHEPALNERCNLIYFDMPESSENGLQAYWVDYEIWFRQTAGFQYRKWVDRYLVMPPYTDHSDAPQHDQGHHGDHKEPQHDDVNGLEK